MRHKSILTLFAGVSFVVFSLCANCIAQETVTNKRARNVLYLTKSSGYIHSVVKREGDRLAHSEQILSEVLANNNYNIVCTKDASIITAEELKKYDTVMFYTSGDLLSEGEDKHPPFSEEGFKAFFDWLRAGGGLIGFHAATDSQRDEKTPTEYTKMIGGAFCGHGKQQYATVKVVDPKFPAMVRLPVEFRMIEEWYMHNQLNVAKTMHVLQLLDTTTMEGERYTSIKPYPITWCSNYGKGRVFYTGLGHREDVWEMPLLHGMILDALAWTCGDVPGDASPNYDAVVK